MHKPKGGRVELAKRIKQHRERLGMSQTDLANAVFVSRQTISNWETDNSTDGVSWANPQVIHMIH